MSESQGQTPAQQISLLKNAVKNSSIRRKALCRMTME